jgi:class 3 adenylate cyclase/tetratricopeptide (TPR) repeat protein
VPTADTNPSEPSAQRRLVTVLFADVVGSTSLAERLDPEDWRAAIRRLTGAMRACVDRYGGRVTSVAGDGVLAIFGAPDAHEDDPIRAVRAALDMVSAIAALEREMTAAVGSRPDVRVGISTGLAIVEGLRPGDRTLDALGDTVNVAARTEAAARPGTVLVTGDTWKYVAHAFVGRPIGSFAAKGKSVPVEAWEIVEARDRVAAVRAEATAPGPLVGRAAECERLLALVEEIQAGHGRAAVVLGEPGVGKSRLLAELRARGHNLPGRPVRWFEARGVSYGVDTPFGLLSGLAEELLDVPGRTEAGDRSAVLLARAGEMSDPDDALGRASLARLLSLPLSPEDSARLADISPEALRSHFLTAVKALLRSVTADHVAVVVLEDAHWADDASVDALELLLPIVHELPILLVISARPERASAGWRLAERARTTFGEALADLTLTPLNADDTRALVASLLGMERVPAGLPARILEHGEGNPLFIEEIVRLFAERGWVVPGGGQRADAEPLPEAEVPDNLRGLLLARIDRLPERHRHALRVAAVIGRDVPVGLLEEVIGDRAETARALGSAEDAGLIRLAGTRPEPVYRFRHVLIQEAAYDSLLKADRRLLHRRVGEALLAGHPNGPEALAAVVGLHFERAGEHVRAAELLHLAARGAMSAFARRDARDLLDRAAALLHGATETPDVERLRIDVDLLRATAGQSFIPYDQSLELVRSALERSVRLGDDYRIGLSAVEEARIRWHGSPLGDPTEAAALQEALRAAVEIGRRLGAPEILAEPRAIEGVMLASRGDREAALPVLDEAVDLLEGVATGNPISVQTASLYAGRLAVTAAELGRFDLAHDMIRRSRQLAERSGDPSSFADADIFDGEVAALEGRREEARDLAQRGAEQAEAVGNLICRTVGSWVAGEQELALGNPGQAITWLETASELAGYCGAVNVERMSKASLLVARAVAGRSPAELANLDGLIEEARTAGDALGEGRMLLQRARVLESVPSGDRDVARSDVDAAIEIFTRYGALPYLRQAQQQRATMEGTA